MNDKIQLSDAGKNALLNYNEEGDVDGLKDWLTTDDGQQYLAELHKRLPKYVFVFRGVNGVQHDPMQEEPKHFHSNSASYVGAQETRDYEKPQAGTPTSWTDDEEIAHQFAIGHIYFCDEPETYGMTLAQNAKRENIIYHHDYVDGMMRFEDEREVTVLA